MEADEIATFTAEYAGGIAGLDLTTEKFYAEYPLPIRNPRPPARIPTAGPPMEAARTAVTLDRS